MGDDRNRIRATVDLFRVPEGMSAAGLTKLRVVIWSGPDFLTPTIARGGLFEEEDAARETADKMVEALELLGIPVEGAYTVPGGLRGG